MERPPKIGDVKQCKQCGEEKAKYQQISSDAHFVKEGAALPEQPGDQFAWSCDACGFEDRLPS